MIVLVLLSTLCFTRGQMTSSVGECTACIAAGGAHCASLTTQACCPEGPDQQHCISSFEICTDSQTPSDLQELTCRHSPFDEHRLISLSEYTSKEENLIIYGQQPNVNLKKVVIKAHDLIEGTLGVHLFSYNI